MRVGLALVVEGLLALRARDVVQAGVEHAAEARVFSRSTRSLQPFACSIICMNFFACPRLNRLRRCVFEPISRMRFDLL